MKPQWEEQLGAMALFVPFGTNGLRYSDKANDGFFAIAREYQIEDDFKIHIPSNRDGWFLVPKVHWRYECDHDLPVKPPYCPTCNARVVGFQKLPNLDLETK